MKKKISQLEVNPRALENDPEFRSLGKGAFSAGIFSVAKPRPSSGEMTVKIVTEKDHMEQLRREVLLTRKLSHNNIRKGFKYKESKTKISAHARLESAPGTALIDLILAHRYPEKGEIPDISPDFPGFEGIRHVLSEILSGLVYLHRKGIVHNDLKPENIIVDAESLLKVNSTTKLKIIDFGLTFEMGSERAKECCGDRNWSSPETYDDKHAKTDRKDVFAFGLIVYSAFCGGFMIPFKMHDGKIDEFREFLAARHKRMATNRRSMWAFPAIRELIVACTNFYPAHRPTAASLVISPFFTQAILSRHPLISESEEST